MTFVVYIVLLAALGITEVWTLRAIAHEFSRENFRKRARTERQDVIIARRLERPDI